MCARPVSGAVHLLTRAGRGARGTWRQALAAPLFLTGMLAVAADAPPVAKPPAAAKPAKPAKDPKANKDGPVFTDPQQADDDFRFQGEYRGYQAPVSGSVRSAEAIGLQVIALGRGEFRAVKYYGGLPGAGWRKPDRFELNGQRTGQLVELRGEQYDIILDGRNASIVTPGGKVVGQLRRVERVSPTMGAAPPPGAIVLFDGQSTDQFVGAKLSPEGWLLAGTATKGAWSDFRLHGEFRIPYKPEARGQARGNSGFYLQGRYEVQVLDSFGLEGVENECAAIYTKRRPDTNMCLPPLQWQTYDIEFHAAKFDANGQKVSDMRISVWHNGVLVHNNIDMPTKTGAGKPEGPAPLPTLLQDHANPVVYRNLWLVDLSAPGPSGSLPIPPSGAPVPIALRPPYPFPGPVLPVSVGGQVFAACQ